MAQALVFFAAGYEPSSAGLAFGLYELSRDQAVQQRLRAEIKEMLEQNDNQINSEALLGMKYLHMVLSEVLRLHPSLPLIDRRCSIAPGAPNYSLRPFADFEMPDGMGIVVPVAAVHRNPEFHPDPDRFDPERFSAANIDKMVPYTYLPFGLGPRNCIGERFGWLQVKIGMVNFLRNHRVAPSGRMKTPMRYSPKSVFLQAEEQAKIFLHVTRDPLV